MEENTVMFVPEKELYDKPSNQIAVYKTSKQLIELLDKLRKSGWKYTSKIHASGDVEDGKQHSLIGLRMLDYSNGTGENTKSVFFNLSPEQIRYWYSRIAVPVNVFQMSKEKIFGETDEDGNKTVTKLFVMRNPVDKNGNIMNYPWYIQIENGVGEPQKTKTGGTFCKSGSYVCKNRVGINMNDEDLFCLLARAVSLIDSFEKEYAYRWQRLSDNDVLYIGVCSELRHLMKGGAVMQSGIVARPGIATQPGMAVPQMTAPGTVTATEADTARTMAAAEAIMQTGMSAPQEAVQAQGMAPLQPGTMYQTGTPEAHAGIPIQGSTAVPEQADMTAQTIAEQMAQMMRQQNMGAGQPAPQGAPQTAPQTGAVPAGMVYQQTDGMQQVA